VPCSISNRITPIVAAAVGRLAAQPLGCDVREAADHGALLGELGGALQGGEPEIDQHDALDRTRRRLEHDVRGLEVAVQDAVAVHGREALERLPRVARRLARRQPGLRLDDVAQRLAAQQLDDQVGLVVLGDAGGVERRDVAVAELGLDVGFPAEPLLDRRVGRQALLEDLERDLASGLQIEGAVDVGHRAPADHGVDTKPLTDHLAGAIHPI
jgi:hypothetical protein